MPQPRSWPGTLQAVCLCFSALFCFKVKELRRNWDVWLAFGQIKTTKNIRNRKESVTVKGKKKLQLKREEVCRSGLPKYNMRSEGNMPALRQTIAPRAGWSRDVVWGWLLGYRSTVWLRYVLLKAELMGDSLNSFKYQILFLHFQCLFEECKTLSS